MEIELIKSVDSDLPEIARIYTDEFSKPPYNENWTDAKAISKIELFQKFYDLYTIKVNNPIAGFVVINPNFMCPGEVAFFEEIAIKNNFQRKGIGTRVIGEIFDIYKNKGFKRCLAIANIEPTAYQLYKKLGILQNKKDVLIEKKLK